MAPAPFPPAAPLPVRNLSVLLAPLGQLSGDGQLRELIEERRERRGADVELWYLEPGLVETLGPGIEALVAGDPAVISWLQLRFGGSTALITLSPTLLHKHAGKLPPNAPPPCL
jgi:hypothetical protein